MLLKELLLLIRRHLVHIGHEIVSSLWLFSEWVLLNLLLLVLIVVLVALRDLPQIQQIIIPHTYQVFLFLHVDEVFIIEGSDCSWLLEVVLFDVEDGLLCLLLFISLDVVKELQ
jgi:hypothetical protein